MRDLLALGLIAFGAYWIYQKFQEREDKAKASLPTIRDRMLNLMSDQVNPVVDRAGVRIREGGWTHVQF